MSLVKPLINIKKIVFQSSFKTNDYKTVHYQNIKLFIPRLKISTASSAR